MRDEFACVSGELGSGKSCMWRLGAQDADVCMRTYIVCFFRMA